MKIKYSTILLTISLIFVSFIGCTDSSDGNTVKEENINFTETLKVCNASEYIDLSTIKDFEKEYAIKIEYSEFESNEDLYSEISANPNIYDIIVPSDYTVDRLIKEGLLEKLDKDKIPNIKNIASEYSNLSYDSDLNYIVPYMVGTLGILYDTKAISEVNSWDVLFNPDYKGKVLMLDSERDVIGLTLKLLGYDINSNNDGELQAAKDKLSTLSNNIQGYDDSEIIRNKIVAGEAVLGVVYSGDGKIALDRNPNLNYIIPGEGSNKWVDGFVIMKGTKHLDAAYKFINFMCASNVAIRNMSTIGYTSPIFGAWGEFQNNTIMFPSADELNRCESFVYNKEASDKYSKLWNEIRKF